MNEELQESKLFQVSNIARSNEAKTQKIFLVEKGLAG